MTKEKRHITRGIKNCRDSRLFKGCSPLQLLCNLIGNRPQSATFHTATVVANNGKYFFKKKMNIVEFLLGISLIILGIIYLVYYIKYPDKYPKLKDGFTHVGQTKITVGIIILFIIGLTIVVSELIKLISF